MKFLKLLTMTVVSQEGCPGPGSASRLSPQGCELGRQEAVGRGTCLSLGLGSAVSGTAKSEDMSRGVWGVWGGEGCGGGSCRWAQGCMIEGGFGSEGAAHRVEGSSKQGGGGWAAPGAPDGCVDGVSKVDF